MYPDSMGRGHSSSVFGTLPDLTLCLFIWLVLTCVLCNKTSFRYSTFLSFVNCSIEPEGVIGTPQICSQLDRSVVCGLRTLELTAIN